MYIRVYLQYGAVFEAVGRWSALEGAECYPRPDLVPRRAADASRRTAADRSLRYAVDIRADGFLFVGPGHYTAHWLVVRPTAVARIELERDPRSAVVDTLVDGHRVRTSRTELHADVGHLQQQQYARCTGLDEPRIKALLDQSCDAQVVPG
jgi:hypothetical protein